MSRDMTREVLAARHDVELERLRGAILQELRRSGPMGLTVEELQSRMPFSELDLTLAAQGLIFDGTVTYDTANTSLLRLQNDPRHNYTGREPTRDRLSLSVAKSTKDALEELHALTGKSKAGILKEALTAMLDAVRAEQKDGPREP